MSDQIIPAVSNLDAILLARAYNSISDNEVSRGSFNGQMLLDDLEEGFCRQFGAEGFKIDDPAIREMRDALLARGGVIVIGGAE